LLLTQTPGPDRVLLLNAAEKLRPALRDRAAEGERLRRVPDRTIDDLVGSKLLRICQPARFGGAEQTWDALIEMGLALGPGDASQAWVAVVYAAMAQMTALFEDEAQHDVWDKNPDALIAGSLVPCGNRAEKVDGGYRLSGKWQFASGVHHAGWTFVGELADIGEGKREHLYWLVSAADYRIDDDWFTAGLAGTGSAAVVLEDVFVPAHRTLFNRDVAIGQSPGTRVNRAPLYRMPLFGFAQQCLASVPIGAACGMVDDFRNHIRARSAKAPASTAAVAAAGMELLRSRLAESAGATRAASLLLAEGARAVARRLDAGAALDESDAANSMLNSGYAVMLAKRAAILMFEASGGQGLFLASPMQRAFRDVHAAANHASLGWDRSALRYGQFALQG
jgi:alkylation response protein AidB-like acyl-CoA dehydrogenase